MLISSTLQWWKNTAFLTGMFEAVQVEGGEGWPEALPVSFAMIQIVIPSCNDWFAIPGKKFTSPLVRVRSIPAVTFWEIACRLMQICAVWHIYTQHYWTLIGFLKNHYIIMFVVSAIFYCTVHSLCRKQPGDRHWLPCPAPCEFCLGDVYRLHIWR